MVELYTGNLGVNAVANLSQPITEFKFIIFEFLSSAGNYVQEVWPTVYLQQVPGSFIINGTFNTSAVRYFLLQLVSTTAVKCINRSATNNLRILGIK